MKDVIGFEDYFYLDFIEGWSTEESCSELSLVESFNRGMHVLVFSLRTVVSHNAVVVRSIVGILGLVKEDAK